MSDLVSEFRDLLNESGGDMRAAKVFLDEVARVVKQKGGDGVDTDIKLPHLITVATVPVEHKYVSQLPVPIEGQFGKKFIAYAPQEITKVEMKPMMAIVMVMPYDNGFVIQMEERYGDMKEAKNLVSYPIPVKYNNADIKKVTDHILKTITNYRKNVKKK
jgi:hypothetical protein